MDVGTGNANSHPGRLYQNDKWPRKGAIAILVEAAGIEPASASYPLQALHAYTVFNLTVSNPTGRVNRQPV